MSHVSRPYTSLKHTPIRCSVSPSRLCLSSYFHQTST
jgi:hypothetical protein